MKSVFSLLLLLAVQTLTAGNGIRYQVDLTHVVNDRVQVELTLPGHSQRTLRFHLPTIIPGTYTEYNFGRVVHDLSARDTRGREVEVHRKDVNTWEIRHARQVSTITYWVDDTYDLTEGKAVSGMSGTNIEEGKNFLLNAHGFFGYIDGLDKLPVEIEVTRPADFYGSSAYTDVRHHGLVDVFQARSYGHMVDMPIMYCRPDTSTIRLGGTDVLISVYSPTGEIESAFLKERYERLLRSQTAYLGGTLPVDRYAFLLYFIGEPLPIGTGALEHNTSSVYCLPEMNQDMIAPFLTDIAAHEFLHILTPLQLHSREIQDFDFANPRMSRHLWLYEGVTEYFAHHNQVRSGMISRKEFLKRMAAKVQDSRTRYQDDLPFTDLSRHCLDRHAGQYLNVYQKGALIGMCLDLELLNWSDGRYGLIDLVQDLSARYGPDHPFRDEDLIGDIEALTGPKIRAFFDLYVTGRQPLDYAYFFNLAGIGFGEPGDTLVYGLGDVQLGMNPTTGRLVVNGTYQLNEFGRALGYKEGDELVSVQGRPLPTSTFGPYFQEIFAQVNDGERFDIVVLRQEGGMAREVTLSAPIRKVRKVLMPEVLVRENQTARQEMVRKAWLEG